MSNKLLILKSINKAYFSQLALALLLILLSSLTHAITVLSESTDEITGSPKAYQAAYLQQLINQVKHNSSANIKPPSPKNIPLEKNVTTANLNNKSFDGLSVKLHLIVTAHPNTHLAAHLQHLFYLHQQKKVPLGQIFVLEKSNGSIDSYSFLYDSVVANSMKLAPKNKDGTWQFGLEQISSLPQGTNLLRSPTWIVEHEQGNYIFDGIEKVEKLFLQNGKFIGHLSQ